MSDRTREALQKLVNLCSGHGLWPVTVAEAREALAQPEQRGDLAPVATAYIERQRLDGSWDMVACFTAPADPSSPDGLPRDGIKVYTAPPSPTVPDAGIDELNEIADGAWGNGPRVRGLARDRAAMLAAPEPPA